MPLFTQETPTTRRAPQSRLALALALCLALALLSSAGTWNEARADNPPRSAAAGAVDAKKVGAKARKRCQLSPRGVTRCRPLVGAAHGANTVPLSLERQAGRSLGVRRTYFTGSQVDSAVATAREDIRAGRVPWISFKLPLSWAAMASGRGDQWTLDLARRLGALPGPVWLAFHHEPEGDGNINDWRKMQERLAPMVRRTASNVAYSVVLTGWNQLYGDQSYRFDNIWPRGVKIDIAGFDLYNEFGVTKNGRYDSRWPCMKCMYYEPIAEWAKANNVAWGIAEFGWTDDAAQEHPKWLRMTYRNIRRAGGVALAYFDTPYNSIASWDLTGEKKQRIFTNLVRRSPVPDFA